MLQEKVIKKKRTRDYIFGLVSDAWRPKGVSFDRHKSKRSNSVVHSEFFATRKSNQKEKNFAGNVYSWQMVFPQNQSFVAAFKARGNKIRHRHCVGFKQIIVARLSNPDRQTTAVGIYSLCDNNGSPMVGTGVPDCP